MMSRFKILTVLMLICVLLTSLAGCGETPTAPEDDKIVHTITVRSRKEAPISGVKVFVYEDSSCTELVSVGTTDEQGRLSFEDKYSTSYVAVLDNVPAGYSSEEAYPLTQDTVIALSDRALTDEEMATSRFGLGDRLPDFTVVDCNGGKHSLYALLEQKKAVVLNYWFLNCNPCKMEFPYLQDVYEQWGEQVAFLALNPVDGTDDAIDAFRTENGLTFPMAKCSIVWQNMLNISAYPTTVIVDRDGYICLIHKGMFTDSKPMMNAMAYFTQNDYQQAFFELIEDIPSMG